MTPTAAKPPSDTAKPPGLRSGGGPGEQEDQGLEIDGLDQVMVEPRLAGPPSVLLMTVAGDGDDAGVPAAVLGPEHAGDLVAVHPRQPDVEQHHLGPERAGRLEGGLAV